MKTFIAATARLLGTVVQARIIDLQWDAQGRFDTAVILEPGKFVEVCGKLSKGQAIAWRFQADAPMNFNIHHHEGKKVEFPAKLDGATAAEGKLAVAVNQDYCWMWSNKSDKAGSLTLSLQQ